MSLEEARQLLARLHQAQNEFYRGDGTLALRELLTEDITWHVPGHNAIAGDYRGIDAVMSYFTRRRDLAGRSFQMVSQQVFAGDGGWIASSTDGSAVIDGQALTWSTIGLYKVRDGRIAACRLVPFDAANFDTIWAAPAAGPAYDASLSVRPRFCDSQGMVHASRYYEFFEDAFLGWLDQHVGGYGRLRDAGTDFVVVASSCEHTDPARLDDRLTIQVRPVRWGRTSLTMSFTIRRHQTIIVTGRTTYVAVTATDGAVPLPQPLTAALHHA